MPGGDFPCWFSPKLGCNVPSRGCSPASGRHGQVLPGFGWHAEVRVRADSEFTDREKCERQGYWMVKLNPVLLGDLLRPVSLHKWCACSDRCDGCDHEEKPWICG